MTLESTFVVAVGSENSAKLRAVEKSFRRIQQECQGANRLFCLKKDNIISDYNSNNHGNDNSQSSLLSSSSSSPKTNLPIKVVGCKVSSGVRDQPISDEETIQGALNRAQAALHSVPEATLGIGLEGGVNKIGNRWYECGWIAVVDRTGKQGIGSSGRFEMSTKIMNRILHDGCELADIMDDLSGQQDVRSNAGAMGILTGNVLHRDDAYSHGIFFALAPFISEDKYWI